MEFSKDSSNSTYQIQSYQEGCLMINHEPYFHSIIIMPEQLINPWEPKNYTELNAKHFELLLPFHPHVVLIGTGTKQQMLSMELLKPLIDHQIGFEIMSTGAACRTFTLLCAEGRHVAAALLID